MNFNKAQYKNIRIFHDPNELDFQYVAFGIDTRDYLTYRRSIYNTTTKEDMYLVDWLPSLGVNHTDLDFNEFIGKEAPKQQIDDDADDFKRKFINRINESTEKIVKERFERGLKYCDEHAKFELKDNFMYDQEFGLFLKTTYETFESKQFNRELGSLITFSLSEFDSLEEAKHEYEFFKDFMFEERNNLIDEFHKQYLMYRDEVLKEDPKEYIERACPPLDKKRDVLNLINYTWLEMFKNGSNEVEYLISGDSTWDEEHGFRFVINKNKEIRVD